jgi:hypothetical protein
MAEAARGGGRLALLIALAVLVVLAGAAAIPLFPHVSGRGVSTQSLPIDAQPTFAKIGARLTDFASLVRVAYPRWETHAAAGGEGLRSHAGFAAYVRRVGGTVSYTIDATVDGGGRLIVHANVLEDGRQSLIDAWRHASRVDPAVAIQFESLARELDRDVVPAPR